MNNRAKLQLRQQHPVEGLPHPFAEAFAQAYARTREELRSGRRDREA